jgi:hypothetical protein
MGPFDARARSRGTCVGVAASAVIFARTIRRAGSEVRRLAVAGRHLWQHRRQPTVPAEPGRGDAVATSWTWDRGAGGVGGAGSGRAKHRRVRASRRWTFRPVPKAPGRVSRSFGFAAAGAWRRELRSQRRRARCGSPDGVSGRARLERAQVIEGLRSGGHRCERRVGLCREARRTVSRTVRRSRSRVRSGERLLRHAGIRVHAAGERERGFSERSMGPGGLRSNRAGRLRRVASRSTVTSRGSGGNIANAPTLVCSFPCHGFVWTHRSRVAAGVVPNARIIGVAGVRPQGVGGRGARCSRLAERAIADGNIRDVRGVDLVQSFVRNHCGHRFSVSLNASPRA